MHVLKAGPQRSVLAVGTGDARIIVKRFHHPSPWQAWRDRGRARAEFRSLERLEHLGIRVPHPVALSFGGGPPEVHMEEVPGARTLERLLEGKGGAVCWELLLRRLGELLARVQAGGVRHPDLHAGNVLVDADDRPWLIDFHNARRRRRIHAAAALSEVIACAAHGREFLPVRLRARFLVAWRKATGLRVDAGSIEAQARIVRRRAIAAGAGRWQRASSRCRVERVGSKVILHARVLPDTAGAGTETIVIQGSERELRARWRNATRLVEHHLPSVWPYRLELERRVGRAVFLAAGEARATSDMPDQLDKAGALSALLEDLHDRGLDLASPTPQDLITDPGGKHLWLPPRHLLDRPHTDS